MMAELQQMKDKNFHGWTINLASGQMSAEPGEDSEELRKTLESIARTGLLHRLSELQPSLTSPSVAVASTAVATPPSPLALADAQRDFIAVAAISEGTRVDYTSYAKQINAFWPAKHVHEITSEEILRFITHLRTVRKNSPSTVDNKVGFLRVVINHVRKMGSYEGGNTASEKNLMSKRQKKKAGAKPYRYNDLVTVFGGPEFAAFKLERPELYLVQMTGLVTGMRVSSVCTLKRKDLKKSLAGTPYIDIQHDKTAAGARDIPIPWSLHNALCEYLKANDGFGLEPRETKGYSDEVRKPINAFRVANGFWTGFPKLTYHSFRKSLTDYLLQQKVPVHICAALLGHEDESMTTGVYATPPSVDDIAAVLVPHQTSLLNALKFQWP